jgi:membrane-associated phospholipid phosphatase
MLAFALATLLSSTDVPIAEPPSPALKPESAPAAAVVAPHLPVYESPFFPRVPITQVLLNTGSTLARPFRPELSDAFVIIPAILGTTIALNTDVETHRAVKMLPDPVLGDRQLSYWVGFLGEGWVDVAIFLGLGLLGGRDGQRVCIAGLQALAATGIASFIGKRMFRLERPSYDREKHHWFSRGTADAMPSGHTMSAFATASVLAQEYPRFAPLFYGLALWVGVARVQQSTHWFSDVVVGAALGTLFGWQSWKLTREFEIDVQPWAGSTGAGLTVARNF